MSSSDALEDMLDVDEDAADSRIDNKASINAKQLEIRRKIEDAIEAKRIREELGYDLN